MSSIRALFRGNRHVQGSNQNSALLEQADTPRRYNLSFNPGFERTGGWITVPGMLEPQPAYDLPETDGGVYTHTHCIAYASSEWAKTGTNSICIQGISGNSDTYVAPGGRKGELRLGMQPGCTYTASAVVRLERPLTGALQKDSLSIVPGWTADGVDYWRPTKSASAPNVPGETRLSVTFTVPTNASAAWIRLMSGASFGHGRVWWDNFSLVEGATAFDYFDGSTEDNEEYVFRWEGEPNASRSIRVYREPQDLREEEFRSIIRKKMSRKNYDEARFLVSKCSTEIGQSSWLDFQSARLYEAEGRPDLAIECYLRAITADPSDAESHYRLGLLYEKARLWEKAADAFEAATNLEPHRTQWMYRLGDSQGKSKNIKGQVESYRRGISGDPYVAEFGQKMLQSEPKLIPERLKAAKFVVENLAAIRERANVTPAQVLKSTSPGTVFMYWGQGFENAPALVKMCRNSLVDARSDYDVIFLDEGNFAYYVDIPDYILKKTSGSPAHFSDVLRLSLLQRYGGAWFDATCFVSQPLDAWLPALTQHDFFAFNYSGPRISNWFLTSHANGYVVSMMKSALEQYWSRYDKAFHYFIFHHIFESLYWIDEDFKNAWDAGIRLDAMRPHELQRSMFKHYDESDLLLMTSESPIHKLKHRISVNEFDPNSYIAYLIRSLRVRI